LPSTDIQPALARRSGGTGDSTNTGSIARLCAATATRLHLIRPLGFSLDDRYLKRAGLDYWPYVDVHVYDNWPQFRQQYSSARLHFFSARAARSYLTVRYARGDTLVFGPRRRACRRHYWPPC